MGAEMVVLFLSALLFFCGLVLILGAGNNRGRKAGIFMLFLGIIGTFICVMSYPRFRNYTPYSDYTNESSNYYYRR